jgi:hypothetical protein
MSKDNIRTKNLMLRCYANKSDDQWQVFCIDFCLAAQGDSFPEARKKLESMISEYVYDALAGEDREFAEQMLNRKAPFGQFAIYYWIKLLHRVGILRNEFHKLFKETVPLVPQHHAHV